MIEQLSPLKRIVWEALAGEFGAPARNTKKVVSWNISPSIGVVLQKDQPNRVDAAYVWFPHPGDDANIPNDALEYPEEAGRHSNTYPSPGLELGKPAMRVPVYAPEIVPTLIAYARALRDSAPLPQVPSVPRSEKRPDELVSGQAPAPLAADPSAMPTPPEPKPRRVAISRQVQREVWQRDGGKCVECGSRERLCFDHIVPFSRGGGNSIRNIQLMCERCNLSKGSRI